VFWTRRAEGPRDLSGLITSLSFATFLVLFSLVFARCAWLTIVEAEEGRALQNRYALSSSWVPAVRGEIRDARGFILARDRASWVIAVDPWAASGRLAGPRILKESAAEHPQRCEARIEELWDALLAFEGFDPILPPAELRAHLIADQRPESRRQYRVVGRIETIEGYQRFQEFRREWHESRGSAFPQPREETRREYPLGDLAIQLVGDVSTRGTPLFGVEERAGGLLAGRRGTEVRQVDAIGRNSYALPEGEADVPSRPGADLELTIDVPAQVVVEEVLAETITRTGAEKATANVMDPHTGAVIAAASFPTCGRGEYQSYFQAPTAEEPNPEPDPVAFDVQLMASLFCLEPGSMIKPLILGRALELGVVGLDTPVPVEGKQNRIRYGRAVRRYTDSHELTDDERDVRGSLVQSSNAGMAWVGTKLGDTRLRDLLRDLRFGELTGFDVREARGLRPDQRTDHPWNDHTTLSIPIGYELLVTPLQVARAYCAIANGGTLVTPHVVARIDGAPVERGPAPRLFPSAVTRTLREVLREAVKTGTGKRLKADAISLAGKTGTAAHYGKAGQIEGWYTSSFAGFAPAEDPRFVVVVTVERPDPRRYYASQTAAPAAHEILRSLLGDREENRLDLLRRDALAGWVSAPIIPGEMNGEGDRWRAENPEADAGRSPSGLPAPPSMALPRGAPPATGSRPR